MNEIEMIRQRNEERRAEIADKDAADDNWHCDCDISCRSCYLLQYAAPESCADIDTLLGKLDEIEKWIDNPHYDDTGRLHRIEVVVRGYVKGKKGGMTEEDEARLLAQIQNYGGVK